MDPGLRERSKIRRLTQPAVLSPEEEGELNVVPFLDVVVNILIFVLATLAVTFTATIDIKTPALPSFSGAGSGRDLTVFVVNDGFAIKASAGNVALGCDSVGPGIAVPKRAGAYDFGGLTACAAKLKRATPSDAEETQIYVTANPGVDYRTIVGVIDALRVSESGELLFPDVSLKVPR
jgi:biopolymer transport protein ExbD